MTKKSGICLWIIYEIKNPNGQVYIGCTNNLKRRINHYKFSGKKQGVVRESISKFGIDGHVFFEVDSIYGTQEDAFSLEMFWIRTKMSNRCKWPEMNGLNLTDGGHGLKGHTFSEETKRKIVLANTGRKMRDSARKNMSLSNARYWLGKPRSEETKRVLSEKHKGKKLSEDHRKKLSIAHKGQISHNRKSIIAYKDGVYYKEYPSVAEAASELGCLSTAIFNNISGRSKGCNGLTFKYASDAC